MFRRRSRDDYAAVAVVWAIGRANDLFGGWLRYIPGEPRILVKDLNTWFGVTSPNSSQRAATLLAAAGLPVVSCGELGDPDLLTRARRRALVNFRDGIPFNEW